jgi:small subunit ribosomal protein S2
LGIVTMKELLEAGVHFGHQTRRWDPHMKPYIFTERNGIHIIDLQKTIAQLKIAYNVVKETAVKGGIVLLVGTKKQAQSAIVEESTRCGMPYVSNRWLGGLITNFATIKNSINRLKRIERMEVDGSFELMTKKEVLNLKREREKLLKNIGGIKDMETLPDMVFIIDPKKEAIAVAECVRARIPIVAIVDTNCNPEGITYPVPGNDDAIRAINLFASIVSSAVIEGQNEAGKVEITEETKIVTLESGDEKRGALPAAEGEEGGYITEESGASAGEAPSGGLDKSAPEAGVAGEGGSVDTRLDDDELGGFKDNT